MTMEGRSWTVGLTTLAVALCLLIAVELTGIGGSTPNPVEARVVAGRPETQADAPTPPDNHAAWLQEIMARPLFSPSRRPAETGVVGLPRLTGIVVAGSQRVAIFAGPPNGRPIIAEAGGHVGAYEVQAIADDGVMVTGPAGTTLLKPSFDAGHSSASTQPNPPARPQVSRPGVK